MNETEQKITNAFLAYLEKHTTGEGPVAVHDTLNQYLSFLDAVEKRQRIEAHQSAFNEDQRNRADRRAAKETSVATGGQQP